MIAELGQFSLILACILALCQGLFPLYGAYKKQISWMAIARPLAVGQFVFVLFAFLCLILAFIDNDFTIRYVAQHSNILLPIWYKIPAVWGGHEGSLLLWVLVLSGWMLAVAWFSRSLPNEIVAWVLGVMGLISIGFLLFVLLTSNPFERLLPTFPVDGKDLNPLLQDIGLIFHPPLLYMGYVGFSVAFAFAIAGLLRGNLDQAWARWSRPWTTVAWCFLSLGIALGSWWAYYELGWGGWWFWDPVENASFMPWLVGTALIHSLAVTEKRGIFKAWTVLLAILAFSLSLLGTFLVRSGVLTSVHAFAADPKRGVFILIFMSLIVGGSFLLFALRANTMNRLAPFSLLSREVCLLFNNLILLVMAIGVLMGTLSPLIMEAFSLSKISVGPPFFNDWFGWMTLLLLIVMGLGMLIRWRHQSWQIFLQPGIGLLVAAVVVAALLSQWLPQFHWEVMCSIGVVVWVALSLGWDFLFKWNRLQVSRWRKWIVMGRGYQGMLGAHLGLLVTVIGVVMSHFYSIEQDIRIDLTQPEIVGDYSVKLLTVESITGPNYTAQRGSVLITKDDQEITHLFPEKRLYWATQTTMTEVAIDAGFTRDIYVALGESLGEDAWSLRIYFKPFIRWIWGGVLIMVLSGMWAVSDLRYRSVQLLHA